MGKCIVVINNIFLAFYYTIGQQHLSGYITVNSHISVKVATHRQSFALRLFCGVYSGALGHTSFVKLYAVQHYGHPESHVAPSPQ
jgi:hypothetical protein